MSFNNIPGQDKTKNILQDTIKRDRISHAYLFLGSKGLGKLEMAREFTRAIFCKENDIDGCGKCISCKKIEHSNHPDFHIIDVEEDHTKILINQIREMQKEISYKPYESDYKVYIINQAGKLTIEAQNSLLKTLEEPPSYAVIILIDEEANELRPTIISRCQKVKLYNQPVEVIENYLIEKNNFTKDDARLYATLSRGKYKKADKLATKEDFIKNREEVIKFLIDIDNKDNYDIFNFTEKLTKLSDTDFPLFELFLSLFRDILLLKDSDKDNNLINFDYIELIKKSTGKYKEESIYELTSEINKYKNYLNKNIKKDLLFPSLLFEIKNKKEI